MRKLARLCIGLCALLLVISCSDDEKVTQINKLPAAAQQFLQQYFGDKEVAVAKVETEKSGYSYDVIFDNGDQVEFDSNGNWEEIDCPSSSVPNAIIPTAIVNYINEHYPNEVVKKIEKDSRKYEVDLSNRVELSFDLNFNLIKTDS